MATLNLNKKKFLSEENVAQIVKIGINFGERLNSIESKCIASYDETHSYLKDELCIYDNYIYKCKSTATGEWNPDRWQLIGDDITELTLDEIKAMLGLTAEQLTTLSSVILDSEVRLDKTYSSSKIYSSIQDAIDTSKAYTLAEIGKASGASYKIANSTSDMTDEKVIYLLQNGSTYDIYIVDGGTPTRIGDVSIDLSDYYTKTEINNDFLKKTDATSTYATKTELNDKADATALDDKVDKTDIVNNLTSTDTNKPLSANQGKILDDKKLNKTNITTTIDYSSTDNQVPSAKSIYYNCIEGIELNQAVIDTYGTEILKYPLGIWRINGDDLASKFTDLPVKTSGRIEITSIDPNISKNPLTSSWSYRVYNFESYTWENYIRKITSANTAGVFNCDTGWQRVCTTGVADVDLTNIAPSDTTTFINFKGNSNCNYCVKNGICYVSLWGVKIASTGGTIKPGVILPKSANNRAGALMTGTGDATEHAFAFIIDTGELCFDVKDANIPLYCSFSYPVSES